MLYLIRELYLHSSQVSVYYFLFVSHCVLAACFLRTWLHIPSIFVMANARLKMFHHLSLLSPSRWEMEKKQWHLKNARDTTKNDDSRFGVYGSGELV
jgi:hypothetical protein